MCAPCIRTFPHELQSLVSGLLLLVAASPYTGRCLLYLSPIIIVILLLDFKQYFSQVYLLRLENLLAKW